LSPPHKKKKSGGRRRKGKRNNGMGHDLCFRVAREREKRGSRDRKRRKKKGKGREKRGATPFTKSFDAVRFTKKTAGRKKGREGKRGKGKGPPSNQGTTNLHIFRKRKGEKNQKSGGERRGKKEACPPVYSRIMMISYKKKRMRKRSS